MVCSNLRVKSNPTGSAASKTRALRDDDAAAMIECGSMLQFLHYYSVTCDIDMGIRRCKTPGCYAAFTDVAWLGIDCGEVGAV